MAASAGAGVAPLGAGLVIEMGLLLAKAGAVGSESMSGGNLPLYATQLPHQSRVASGGKYMIFQASCKPFHAVLER